jgi:hypothetical protein
MVWPTWSNPSMVDISIDMSNFNHTKEDGRALFARYAVAYKDMIDLETRSRQLPKDAIEIVAEERNLRRELDKWMWDNIAELLK